MKDYSVLEGLDNNFMIELRCAFDRGYRQGRDDEWAATQAGQKENEYDRGLNDAWECCKRFWQSDENICRDIFNIICWEDFFDLSPFEAIEKFKEYDKKTFDVPDNCKIEVGDVVETNGFGKPVIVISAPDDLDSSAVKVMNFLGDTAWKDIKNCKKTGKHIQQIEEVFNMLRDNKNA